MRRLHGSMVWAALVTVAGCGGKASDVALEPGPPALPPPSAFPPANAVPGAVRPPSGASSGGGSSTGGMIGTNPPRDRPRRYPPNDDPPANEPPPNDLAALAEFVLATFCGDCHGESAIENGNVQGGIDYITDIDRLTLEGWIIPLRSAESPLIQLVSEGRMPPPGVEPRPTNDEILILRSFIDDPLLWPVNVPPAVDAGAPPVVDAGLPPVPSDAGDG